MLCDPLSLQAFRDLSIGELHRQTAAYIGNTIQRQRPHRLFLIVNQNACHWASWVVVLLWEKGQASAFFQTSLKCHAKSQEWQQEQETMRNAFVAVLDAVPTLPRFLWEAHLVSWTPKDLTGNDCGPMTLAYVSCVAGEPLEALPVANFHSYMMKTRKDSSELRQSVLRAVRDSLPQQSAVTAGLGAVGPFSGSQQPRQASRSPSSPPVPEDGDLGPVAAEYSPVRAFRRSRQPQHALHDQNQPEAGEDRDQSLASAEHDPAGSFCGAPQPRYDLRNRTRLQAVQDEVPSSTDVFLELAERLQQRSSSAFDTQQAAAEGNAAEEESECLSVASEDHFLIPSDDVFAPTDDGSSLPRVRRLNPHTVYNEPSSITLPLPTGAGSRGGNADGTTYYQRLLTNGTLKYESAVTANGISCLFCSTLQHFLPAVVCHGSPCRNCVSFGKPFLSVDANITAELKARQVVPCVHCAVANRRCSGISGRDVHALARPAKCGACKALNEDCVSILNPVLPLRLFSPSLDEDADAYQPRTLQTQSGHMELLCSLCPLAFPNLQELRYHSQMHICGTPFYCPWCLTILETPASLVAHVKDGTKGCGSSRRSLCRQDASLISSLAKCSGRFPERLQAYLDTSQPLVTVEPEPERLSGAEVVVVAIRYSSFCGEQKGMNVLQHARSVAQNTILELRNDWHVPDTVPVHMLVLETKSWLMRPVWQLRELLLKEVGNSRRVVIVARGVDGFTTNCAAPEVLRNTLTGDWQIQLLLSFPQQMRMREKCLGARVFRWFGGGHGQWQLHSLEMLAESECRSHEIGNSKKEERRAALALMDLWRAATFAKRPWETRNTDAALLVACAGRNRNALV